MNFGIAEFLASLIFFGIFVFLAFIIFEGLGIIRDKFAIKTFKGRK